MDTGRQAELRAAYSRFLRPGRILLTGHSHQAWPDVARDAQQRWFDDAAELVDDKWDRAIFPMAERVGRGILERMGFAADDAIAFGESTHQLVYRLLSCFDLRERPRVVTTSGEFHSLHRQLRRLSEDGLEVEWVPAQPREGLSERLLAALTPGVSLLAVSAVLFEDAYILPQLTAILERALEVGAVPLVDGYHAFNVVPLTWGSAGAGVYATAGGYKYAAFGNGLCWLRIPSDCQLRPAYTGWFADFDNLSAPRELGARVGYSAGGMRFAGATFDGSALYRADAVLEHWQRFGLGVAELRAISTRQTERIITGLEAGGGIDLVSARDAARRGGFVTVRHARAGEAVARLRERGVFVDARGDRLRLGPAPYLLDEEIDQGVDATLAVLRGLSA